MKNEFDFSKISMSIILPAGEARTKASEALDAMMDDDTEKAENLIKEAKEYIKEAHKAQTDVLQALAAREYDGNCDPVIFPMLFIHAQDTIMTIMSEVNMSEKMIKMYKKIKEI